jgi:hypothetical protein
MVYRKTILLFISFLLFITCFANNYPDLRTVLNSQINDTVINVPKATYTLDLMTGSSYIFSGKKNITINGNGSTIICNRQSQAFYFDKCENVKFSNFHIEYDPPCFTQGTITAMSTNKLLWEVTIHDGYPVNNVNLQGKVQVFGKNTLELVQNYNDIYSAGITKTGTNIFQVRVPSASDVVKTGDFAVFDVLDGSGLGIQAHGIMLSACKNMLLDSIVMYDSNCFSFFETDCEKDHYYRCVVTRKPFDSKYTIQPLRAGSADGIHSKYAKTGPIVEECTLGYNGDDCIAINGNFYPVYNVNVSNKRIYLLSPSVDLKISVGDTVVCVNNNGSVRGQSIVKSLMSTMPTSAQITTCYSKLGSQSSSNWTYGVAMVVDTLMTGTSISDYFYSKNRSGAGFKVINNQIGHNRSRGIIIKASDGLISGNTIVGSAMSGILLSPEFYWMEGGCPSNIEICNNTIRNCMYYSNMSGSSQPAALVVVSSPPKGGFAEAGSLNNYSIHNNVIEGCPRPCVVLTSINGVKYFDNTITPDLSMIRTHGANFGVPNNTDFWMINVTNFSTINSVSDDIKINNDNNIIIDNSGNLSLSGLKENEVANIKVCDLTGRMVINKELSNNNIISTMSLKKGVYIVVVNYNQSRFTRKIIVK